jgi:DNA-3-methyladenine glycosylase
VLVLPQAFYRRDALEVARDLLGKVLMRGEVLLRITEVEAYRWPGDTASHCRMGRTPRNEPMWGPPGHAYVYLCYGLHRMLNVVTNEEGEGAAVLVRSAEPLQGHALITARRGGLTGPRLLDGPGKLGSALDLATTHSGTPLFGGGVVTLLDAPPVERVLVGPRIGIDFASARDRRAPYRLAVAGTEWVSHRQGLKRSR